MQPMVNNDLVENRCSRRPGATQYTSDSKINTESGWVWMSLGESGWVNLYNNPVSNSAPDMQKVQGLIPIGHKGRPE